MMLCTLQMVKDYLGITDNSQDTKLNLMIKQASSLIEGFVGYSLERKVHTEEVHNVNNMQLIQLDNQPIQFVQEVKINGTVNTEWKRIPKYDRMGMLYKGNGWVGSCYVRGMANDIVAGAYVIEVTYASGYYLPDSENYEEGESDSLPFEFISACLETVSEMYNVRMNNAEGIKQHSEGGISTTFAGADSSLMGENGLSKKVCDILADFKRYGVA